MSEPIKGREPFSMLIHAIERDLERTPDGNGGEVYYFPATDKHGGMGHNGEYLLKEWQEVTADLAASVQMHEEARALLDQTLTERDDLRKTLTDAPHMDYCQFSYLSGYENIRCTCWKAEI